MSSGKVDNYFEILELSSGELQGQDEATIVKRVNQNYAKLYSEAIRPEARNRPRLDGRDPREWPNLVQRAKDTLIDPAKRRAHIEELSPQEERESSRSDSSQSRPIVKFPNGDEATSILELATLMEKNSIEAGAALYRGSIALSLDGAGEWHFAEAAREVVSRYPKDRKSGLTAMVQILKGKIYFERGGEAGTPQDLARLIDKNWAEAKTLLFNGSIAFWLEYVGEQKSAETAKKIVSLYSEDQDRGLELLVQKLNPRIGSPDLKTSHTSINFGKIDNETKKTIHLKIENAGRGFLYGDVQLASKMPGLQISSTPIIGSAVVTVELDASSLTVKQTHKTELIINTNSGKLIVPISCSVDYPIHKSIRRVVVSGISMSAIALVARLIAIQLTQLEGSKFGWLTSARFVDLDANWVPWFEWPMIDQILYIPDFAGFSFVISFAALGTGIFFFLRKRGSR